MIRYYLCIFGTSSVPNLIIFFKHERKNASFAAQSGTIWNIWLFSYLRIEEATPFFTNHTRWLIAVGPFFGFKGALKWCIKKLFKLIEKRLLYTYFSEIWMTYDTVGYIFLYYCKVGNKSWLRFILLKALQNFFDSRKNLCLSFHLAVGKTRVRY